MKTPIEKAILFATLAVLALCAAACEQRLPPDRARVPDTEIKPTGPAPGDEIKPLWVIMESQEVLRQMWKAAQPPVGAGADKARPINTPKRAVLARAIGTSLLTGDRIGEISAVCRDRGVLCTPDPETARQGSRKTELDCKVYYVPSASVDGGATLATIDETQAVYLATCVAKEQEPRQ